MCNHGGAAALLGAQDSMELVYPGTTRKELEQAHGHELGVVRISLGLASSFQDVRKVLLFAAAIGNETSRQVLWRRWMDNTGVVCKAI
jgi:molybdenum cofactor sulfurtransferase